MFRTGHEAGPVAHHGRGLRRSCLAGVAVLVLLSPPPSVSAACHEVTGASEDPSIYRRHLSEDCSPAEREARAVSAEALLAALKQGKSIDLSRVVVTGDLLLDELPQVPIASLRSLRDRARVAAAELSLEEGRVIAGSVSIRDSIVRGRIATRIRQGMVIVQGAVTMTGTQFEGAQDWGRTLFAGPIDWRRAAFRQEAVFVQARFLEDVHFLGTQFGPHTRFHQSRFEGTVSFDDADFQGLSEFLEVTFHRDISFSRARFREGTGFSGSRFGGAAVFTDAHFGREAYFLFTRFQGAAQFGHARFDNVAGFADADFQGLADFSNALFTSPADWDRARFRAERLVPPSPAAPVDWLNYGIILGAGLAALLLFWIVLRP